MPRPDRTPILVAESPELRRMIVIALEQGGFAAAGCEPAQAARLLREGGFRVLVTGVVEHALNPMIPTVYLALEPPPEPVPAHVRMVMKPFPIASLLENVRQLLMLHPSASRKPIGGNRRLHPRASGM